MDTKITENKELVLFENNKIKKQEYNYFVQFSQLVWCEKKSNLRTKKDDKKLKIIAMNQPTDEHIKELYEQIAEMIQENYYS